MTINTGALTVAGERALIVAFPVGDAVPSPSMWTSVDCDDEPETLHQIFPRNTEPIMEDDIGRHHIRTVTRIVDGVMRMTMTDICCGVEAVTERTLTDLLVGRGATR